MTRLVQVRSGPRRLVAVVDEPHLCIVGEFDSVYEMVQAALRFGASLASIVQAYVTSEVLDYDSVLRGESEWRVLVPIDHPWESSRCLVSGTGLTHLGSAQDRQAMHQTDAAAQTDSMRMFRLGLEGGRPVPGAIGSAPEWFYKGTGATLRAHGEALEVPTFAEDGGEEAEVAGV